MLDLASLKKHYAQRLSPSQAHGFRRLWAGGFYKDMSMADAFSRFCGIHAHSDALSLNWMQVEAVLSYIIDNSKKM